MTGTAPAKVAGWRSSRGLTSDARVAALRERGAADSAATEACAAGNKRESGLITIGYSAHGRRAAGQPFVLLPGVYTEFH